MDKMQAPVSAAPEGSSWLIFLLITVFMLIAMVPIAVVFSPTAKAVIESGEREVRSAASNASAAVIEYLPVASAAAKDAQAVAADFLSQAAVNAMAAASDARKLATDLLAETSSNVIAMLADAGLLVAPPVPPPPPAAGVHKRVFSAIRRVLHV